MRDLRFRPLLRGDFPLAVRWLAQSHVASTEWGTVEASLAGAEGEFGRSVDGEDGTTVFLVSEGERPIGIIQSYRIGDDPEYSDDLWMVVARREAIA